VEFLRRRPRAVPYLAWSMPAELAGWSSGEGEVVQSGDGEPRVGVDDVVVGGVPANLRLIGEGVAAGGDQDLVHDQYGGRAEPLALL